MKVLCDELFGRSNLKNPVYEGKIAYGRRHTVKVEGTNNETKVMKQDDESKIILENPQ